MNILGISCYYHDAAAALIRDGEVVAAAEEERFSRIKHDSSFPKRAVDFCLETGHVSAKDLDYVVFYEKPFRKLHRILISNLSTFPRSYLSFREGMRIFLTQKLWIKDEIASRVKIDTSNILFSEHHLSHAAGCFYPSPFNNAAIVTVDGVGEWATASYGVGKENKIFMKKELNFPQSLGLLYSAFTAFLGFEVNEGEWKVMGLAPYGKPTLVDKIWKTVCLHSDGSFSLDFSYFAFQYSDKYSFSSKFIDLFGEPVKPEKSHLISPKSANLAASIQKVTEDILLHVTKHVKKETGMKHLCMSGGVALNSVANYKILKESGFENVYIQPAPGDSGGAIGAALYTFHHVLNKPKRHVISDGHLGKEYTNEDIVSFLKKSDIPYKTYSSYSILTSYVADKIAKGKVVGWMQGRFEWGPRALGARSILADPRNPKMKDIINAKVKFREAFRPFAPSVLSSHASNVFDIPNKPSAHYPLRFMLYVVPVRPLWRKKVPAITHADNTARPQLVFEDIHPLYYQLIHAFFKKTGVPLVLNTSFNLKGEPIVSSPQDAYSTYMRSGIDMLVMGKYVCEKTKETKNKN